MVRIEIYEVDHAKRGELVATVDNRGKVEPDTALGVVNHVKRLMREPPIGEGLKGKKLLERLERSYTNGYLMARTVK